MVQKSKLELHRTSSKPGSSRRDAEISFSDEGVPVGTPKAETEIMGSSGGSSSTGILRKSSRPVKVKRPRVKLIEKNADLDTIELQNSLELFNLPVAKKASVNNSKSKTVTHPIFVNKNLKDVSYARKLAVTRKNLPYSGRLLSKFLHSPVIDKLSEFTAETIARPVALTGGSVAAFIGTVLLFLVSNHYGYDYNYSATLILFIAGMIFTLAVEIIFRVIQKLK